MKMTKPIKLVLITTVARYLQSIGPLDRVSSDRTQNLNDLLQRCAANTQGGDVLESGALKYQPHYVGAFVKLRGYFLLSF